MQNQKTGQKNLSKKIMMRKYGLDEGQLYIEQSTLLEPNNFIPSWEAGDEEKKEVSLALKKLRKKYDDIHMMTLKKDEDLQLIQKKFKNLPKKNVVEGDEEGQKKLSGVEAETKQIMGELEEVKEQHLE